MNIALIGYGKMGKAIESLALDAGHLIVARTTKTGFTATDINLADVCIEFSSPDSGFENIEMCIAAGKPVISGTTGWTDRLPEIKALVEKHDGAFFYASNFSLGVNIFWAANQFLAKLMNHFDAYTPSIHEVHHTQKLDAPSGTAITTAQQIVAEIDRLSGYALNAKDNETLNITAERIDPAPGTHIVKYLSAIDDIELTHTAHSRQGFAKGALLAAEWIVGKKGCFGMNDMLNLNTLK